MPDHAARSLFVPFRLGDPCQRLTDGKILLIAGNLLHVLVEDDVPECHLQQSFRSKQAVQQTILWRRQPLSRCQNLLHLGNDPRLAALKHSLKLLGRQWGIDQLGEFHIEVVGVLFFPRRPEFSWRSGCAVLPLILADRRQQLRIDEQPRNLILSLVAKIAPLFMSDIRVKHDITWVGETAFGIPLYTFRYVEGFGPDGIFEGVMAQDLLLTNPDAVVHMPDGHLAVDYSMIDADFLRVGDAVGEQE